MGTKYGTGQTYRTAQGNIVFGYESAGLAERKAGVKIKDWSKFYPIIESIQIGLEPGERGRFQLEGLFDSTHRAVKEIRDFEQFRRDFQKYAKVKRAGTDARFELSATVKTCIRKNPHTRPEYWVELNFTYLPEGIPTNGRPWEIVVN